MLVAGPQRRLFFACVLVGFSSLLSLDLHFAPMSLAAGDVTDAGPAPSRAPPTGPAPNAAAPAPLRVVIPAPARVPTIVARFERAAKEPTDQSAIRALATAMIEDHDVSIVLEGHSDTMGGDDYNHTISLERASWVKARLVELGVSPDRIETVGLGATRPLRSDDPDAPSVNRRVEVRWLGSVERGAPPPPKPVPKAAAATGAPKEPAPATSREPAPPKSAAADAAAATSVADASAATATTAPDASLRATEGEPSVESPHSPLGGESLQPGDD